MLVVNQNQKFKNLHEEGPYNDVFLIRSYYGKFFKEFFDFVESIIKSRLPHQHLDQTKLQINHQVIHLYYNNFHINLSNHQIYHMQRNNHNPLDKIQFYLHSLDIIKIFKVDDLVSF